MPTTAIIHCGGISLRKFLSCNDGLVFSECPSGQFRNETIAQPLAFIMKRLKFHILILIILSGCLSSEKETCKIGFPDKDYPFLQDIKRQSDFDYLATITDFRQFGSFSNNDWLRSPKNLELFYGSLKMVGLKKFISKEEFNKPLFTSHFTKSCWENKSLNQILKNFIKSFSSTTGFDKYYVEFWNRRKKENNEKIVFQIFNDVLKDFNSENPNFERNWKPEPTITGLLEYETKLKHSDSLIIKQVNKEYFQFLKNKSLYSSANNLIRYANENEYSINGNWDKEYEQLIKSVETDSVNCDKYWNWRENAKWFVDIYDYGP